MAFLWLVCFKRSEDHNKNLIYDNYDSTYIFRDLILFRQKGRDYRIRWCSLLEDRDSLAIWFASSKELEDSPFGSTIDAWLHRKLLSFDVVGVMRRFVFQIRTNRIKTIVHQVPLRDGNPAVGISRVKSHCIPNIFRGDGFVIHFAIGAPISTKNTFCCKPLDSKNSIRRSIQIEFCVNKLR